MKCHQCHRPAAVRLQHGNLCRNHFLIYFEEKVFRTINQHRLFGREDIVCVAASGGKDSTTALYLLKKYFQKYHLPEKNFFALLIDEGIRLHRRQSRKNLKQFCRKEKIRLEVVRVKDNFSTTLDESAQRLRAAGRKPCTVCGIWRRYLLNKHARKKGATRLVTGHNLDDEAQSIVMNLFKANTSLAANLGPVSGIKEHPLFVPRIKPLFFCTNEEVERYTKIKKWVLDYCGCPYAQEGYRSQVKKMLNEFEKKYPGTKQGVIKSYLELLPLMKEKLLRENCRGEIELCRKCGEPANQKVCHACQLAEELVGKVRQKKSPKGKASKHRTSSALPESPSGGNQSAAGKPEPLLPFFGNLPKSARPRSGC